MIARRLPLHSPRAVQEALVARGWDSGRADAAAGGMPAAAIELSGLDDSTLLALLQHAGTLGLDLLTGPDWAIVAGSESRLSALARPWVVPPPLAAVAEAVGLRLLPDPPEVWVTRTGSIPLDRPVIAGILNLTPDSFSDGGRYLSPDSALAQADILVSEGAAILDLGGESTRPGSEPVPEAEELGRVLPVVEALTRRHPGIERRDRQRCLRLPARSGHGGRGGGDGRGRDPHAQPRQRQHHGPAGPCGIRAGRGHRGPG